MDGPSPRNAPGRLVPVAMAGLAVLAVAVYGQTGHHGFVNLDDPEYVYRNRMVLAGLSREGIAWAFSGFHVANWHPLTWLSHMLDVELFGAAPGPHHLVSVFLHVANTVVLFHVLRCATGAIWRSLAVAALFAVHPLHVESVAWVSERKDLLSTLFFLLSLWAYAAYVRSRRSRDYALALGLFGSGLLCKPMIVTLPFVLLLLDVWPFRRVERETPPRPFGTTLLNLVVEKTPFFVLALASCVVTYLAQSAGGGASALAPIRTWPRIANAIISFAAYLGKTAWPASLAAFYPHPATIRPDVPLWPLAGATLAIAAISVWALRERTRCPYILWGWLWYLGTLVPVIGLVQVGGQAMADRYTYIPLIGCFVALVWSLAEWIERRCISGRAVATVTVAVILALAVAARKQAGYWRDSVTLNERTIAVTDRNWKAWQGLCDAKLELGRYDEAIPACREAIRILPTFPEAWDTLGVVHARKGEPRMAVPYFVRALELRPDYFNATLNLGSAMGNLGDYPMAIGHFHAALRLRPDDPEAWAYLAIALARSGDRRGALEAYGRVRQLDSAKAEFVRDRLELRENDGNRP